MEDIKCFLDSLSLTIIRPRKIQQFIAPEFISGRVEEMTFRPSAEKPQRHTAVFK